MAARSGCSPGHAACVTNYLGLLSLDQAEQVVQVRSGLRGAFLGGPGCKGLVVHSKVRACLYLVDHRVRHERTHRVVASRDQVDAKALTPGSQRGMVIDGTVVREGDEQQLALQDDPGLGLGWVKVTV